MRVPLIVTSCLASAAIGGVVANVATAPAATAPNTGLRGAYVLGIGKCPSDTVKDTRSYVDLAGAFTPHAAVLCKVEH